MIDSDKSVVLVHYIQRNFNQGKSVGLRLVSPVSLADWRLSHHQDSADAIVERGEKSSAAARRVVLGPFNTESCHLSAMCIHISKS